MISKELSKELIEYWAGENVACIRAEVAESLDGTDLALIWARLGMPKQDWWKFHFAPPTEAAASEQSVTFGGLYRKWSLQYVIHDGRCIVIDERGLTRFANSSMAAFMKTLVIFDRAAKRVMRECGGDSGEEWDRGDVIIQEMERAMRDLDPPAFQDESCLWPYLVIDING